jgi:hypothetical protein
MIGGDQTRKGLRASRMPFYLGITWSKPTHPPFPCSTTISREAGMVSNLQHIAGIRVALTRLEQRVKDYREALIRIDLGTSTEETRDISKGEVETVEELILELHKRMTGLDEPSPAVWERAHPYCSRNGKTGLKTLTAHNIEYFHWFLLWIQKTHAFLDYLEGLDESTQRDDSPG